MTGATATQSGASVSGPFVLRFTDDDGTNVTINGSFTGTVSGAELTSTRFTVAAGAIPDPQLATCTSSGTGTYAATTGSVSGAI